MLEENRRKAEIWQKEHQGPFFSPAPKLPSFALALFSLVSLSSKKREEKVDAASARSTNGLFSFASPLPPSSLFLTSWALAFSAWETLTRAKGATRLPMSPRAL